MKELFLLRGLPGAGKSTLAESIGGMHMEADKYFMYEGKYEFDPSKTRDAHAWCQNAVSVWMTNSVQKNRSIKYIYSGMGNGVLL
jgi:adenylate kinase family enzyme